MQGKKENQNQIGIWIVTSLVVGNMIGSGIFLLPAAMANIGGISILGWVISGFGAILIAKVFGRLSRLAPKSCGPYGFPKEGFGEFTGFLSGWSYWISVLTTNASIAMVFTGYLLVFIPGWSESQGARVGITLSAIWFLTWLNSRGVRSGGIMQLTTTILKVLPLLAVTLLGLFLFNSENFIPLNRGEVTDIQAIGASITLTLFAFLGIESATVPASNIVDPEITIPRATIIGTIFTTIIYMLSSISIMGIIPPDQLSTSTAPFAEAAAVLWGDTGKYLVGFGALISTFGALNGWILIQGQMPLAMAEDDLFPPLFKKRSKRNFPLKGLIISSILVSTIVLANYSKGLVAIFTMLILVGTFLTLVAYLLSSLSEALILIRGKMDGWKSQLIKAFLYGIPAFAFSMWAVIGAGKEIVFYGFIILMLGIPVYIWSKIKKARVDQNE